MGAELGNSDLIVGQHLEQIGLELLVGAVDLVDQQHRRVGLGDCLEQRAFQQVGLGEDVLLAGRGTKLARFQDLYRQELALVVPLIDGSIDVQPFVTLQADEPAVERLRERFGNFGLADAGVAFEEQRTLQVFEQEQRRGQLRVGDVADSVEPRLPVARDVHREASRTGLSRAAPETSSSPRSTGARTR